MTWRVFMIPENIILSGITGSVAYGLDTKDSDEDIKGIYILPTRKILSVGFNLDKTTKDHTEPDWVYHEVGKFIKLAMAGNPTILEMLWLNEYLVLNKFGKMLVDNRHLFISEKAVRSAYSGYVFSQARKLKARGGTYGNGRNKRYKKHTRHLFRLLIQGKQLLESGTMDVRVTQEQREWLFNMGRLPVNEIIEIGRAH